MADFQFTIEGTSELIEELDKLIDNPEIGSSRTARPLNPESAV